MSDKRIVGIDFGTSTSVIKVKTYDENDKSKWQELYTLPVTFNNGSAMVPSVVRRFGENDSGSYSFGFDAEHHVRNSDVFRGFKVDLQSNDSEKAEQAKLLTKKFFEYLYKEYDHQRNTGHLGDVNDTDFTIVSYPVKWETSTCQFMLDAAKSAGFKNVTGMNEAEAAISAISVQCKEVLKKNNLLLNDQPSNIMLIDMGAGTTDIVICKNIPGEQTTNEILTTWPKGGNILFGGQEIDLILKDFIISKFPDESREMIAKKISIDNFKSWKENTVSPALQKNDIVHECSPVDMWADIYDVYLDDINLDRNKFEELFFDHIIKFVRLVGGAIIDSELSPEDIDLIILTGGHSRWYFVKEILEGKNLKFGNLNLTKIFAQPGRILSVALPQETVALGLAYSKLSGNIKLNKAEHLWKTYLETKSIAVLEEAARLEYAQAQNELAFLYWTGNGIQKNNDEAIRLYKLSANNGYTKAIYNLADCYFALKDYEKAFNKFSEAIRYDIPEAYNNLAFLYRFGLGIEQNLETSLDLYKKSYELGYVDAKKSYISLYKKLYPDNPVDALNDYDGDDVFDYIKNIINTQLPNLSTYSRSLYFSFNSLPKDKISNFISCFPDEIPEITQNIICYMDSTFFGGGKDGFILTDKKIYWHGFLGGSRSVDVKNIKNVTFFNGNLIVTQNSGTQNTIPYIGAGCDISVLLTKVIMFLNDRQ